MQDKPTEPSRLQPRPSRRQGVIVLFFFPQTVLLVIKDVRPRRPCVHVHVGLCVCVHAQRCCHSCNARADAGDGRVAQSRSCGRVHGGAAPPGSPCPCSCTSYATRRSAVSRARAHHVLHALATHWHMAAAYRSPNHRCHVVSTVSVADGQASPELLIISSSTTSVIYSQHSLEEEGSRKT